LTHNAGKVKGKASAIALENPARNTGFNDALRFGWPAEDEKIKDPAILEPLK
jgi:hypothetical protein